MIICGMHLMYTVYMSYELTLLFLTLCVKIYENNVYQQKSGRFKKVMHLLSYLQVTSSLGDKIEGCLHGVV